MASEPLKVFISYNRADRDWAEWIAGTIESAGYEPIIQAWDFRLRRKLRIARAGGDRANGFHPRGAVRGLPPGSGTLSRSGPRHLFRTRAARSAKLIPVRVAGCTLTGILAPIIRIDLVGLGEPAQELRILTG